MKKSLLISLMGTVGLLVAADRGSRTIPKPNEPIPKQEIIKLTGQFKDTKLSRDIRILWLYGPEDHGGGEHCLLYTSDAADE